MTAMIMDKRSIGQVSTERLWTESPRARIVPAMKSMIAAALLSPEMHPTRVGERIAAVREAMGLRKADFADAISLDRSSLTKIEAGEKGLDVVVGARIADLYGIGMDFIYRGVMADLPAELRTNVSFWLHGIRTEKAAGVQSARPRKARPAKP